MRPIAIIATVVLNLSILAAAAEKKKVELLQQWPGRLANNALKAAAPADGFVADAAAWATIWKSWRGQEAVPAVDLEKELVLVGVVDGPNRAMLIANVDEKKDVQVVVAGTRMAGPGFGYTMARIRREGIETINGKPIGADKPATRPATQPAGAGVPVQFDTYNGYFVSNKFEPGADLSVVVLKDQDSFDGVFGVGFVMNDRSHRLAQGIFQDHWVLAVIHRGNPTWEYTVQKVERKGGELIVRYTTTRTPHPTASFACPLILSVPRGEYKTVRFIEDKKPLKELPLR